MTGSQKYRKEIQDLSGHAEELQKVSGNQTKSEHLMVEC